MELAEGAVLGGVRKEKQHEKDLILRKETLVTGWGCLLGQRRAHLLIFRCLSCQVIAGTQPESGRSLVRQAASELQGVGRKNIKKSPGDFFLVIDQAQPTWPSHQAQVCFVALLSEGLLSHVRALDTARAGCLKCRFEPVTSLLRH